MFKLYVASVNLSLWAGQSRDKQTIVKDIGKGPRQKKDNAKGGGEVCYKSLGKHLPLYSWKEKMCLIK